MIAAPLIQAPASTAADSLAAVSAGVWEYVNAVSGTVSALAALATVLIAVSAWRRDRALAKFDRMSAGYRSRVVTPAETAVREFCNATTELLGAMASEIKDHAQKDNAVVSDVSERVAQVCNQFNELFYGLKNRVFLGIDVAEFPPRPQLLAVFEELQDRVTMGLQALVTDKGEGRPLQKYVNDPAVEILKIIYNAAPVAPE